MINIVCKSFRIYPCTSSSRSQHDGNGFRWLRPLSLWLLFLGFYQPAFAVLRCEFGTSVSRRFDSCSEILRRDFTNTGEGYGLPAARFRKVNSVIQGADCQTIRDHPFENGGRLYCLPYKDRDTGLVASFRFTTLSSTPVAVPAHKLTEAKALIGKNKAQSGAKYGYQRLSTLCTRYGGKRVQECMTHSKGLMDQVLMFPKVFGLCIAPFIPSTHISANRGMSSSNISDSLPSDEDESVTPFAHMGKYFDPNATNFEEQDTELDVNARAPSKAKCPGNRFVMAANQAFNTWAATWRMKSFPAGTWAPGVKVAKAARARSAALVSPFSSADALTDDPDALLASAAQATLNDPLYEPQIAAGIDPSETPRSSDEPDEPDDSSQLSRLDASARAAATAVKKDKATTNYFRKVASVPRNLVLNAIFGTNAAVPTVPATVSEREQLWRSRMLQQVKDLDGGKYNATFVGGASVGIYARLGVKYANKIVIGGIPIPLAGQVRVATTIASCAPVVGCSDIVSNLRKGILTQTIQFELGSDLSDIPAIGDVLNRYGIGAGVGVEVDMGMTEHTDAWGNARIDFVSVQTNVDASGVAGGLAQLGQAYMPKTTQRFNNFTDGVRAVTNRGGEWMSIIEAAPSNYGALLATGMAQAGLVAAKGVNYLWTTQAEDFSLFEFNPWKVTIMNPNYVNQVVYPETKFKSGWDGGWPYVGTTTGAQAHFGHKWEGSVGSNDSPWGKLSVRFQIYTIVKGELGAAFSKNGKTGLFAVLARSGGG